MKEIRTSIKLIKGPDSTQTSFASAQTTEHDQFNFKAVFNGNLKKITDIEMQLAKKRT